MKLNFCKITFIYFLLLFAISCSNKCIVNNIEVSELLGTVSKERSIDYCKLLKIALKADNSAIQELTLLEFDNAVGYDHGKVIVDLITVVGEAQFIKAISKTNKEQKILIHSYIDVGLKYGTHSSLQGKDFKNIFPDLYVFLKE